MVWVNKTDHGSLNACGDEEESAKEIEEIEIHGNEVGGGADHGNPEINQREKNVSRSWQYSTVECHW